MRLVNFELSCFEKAASGHYAVHEKWLVPKNKRGRRQEKSCERLQGVSIGIWK
jgi:hypothetical protein